MADAKARLHDAEAFLEVAQSARDPDVAATNAVHAAIAAADAICCVAMRERSADGHHATAVGMLGEIDTTLAAALRRAVDHKNQAAYEARDITATDANTCVRQAATLVEAARIRVQGL